MVTVTAQLSSLALGQQIAAVLVLILPFVLIGLLVQSFCRRRARRGDR